MRLARLRNQMLIAMGLPACWTQAEPVARPTPAVAAPRDTDGGAFDPTACRADTLPETICGGVDPEHRPGSTCGPRGDSLQSFGESKLVITEPSYQRSDTLRHFRLDDDATRAYQTKLASSLDPRWLAGYCCYARCTPLAVSRAVTQRVPPDHHLENTCLPAPPGGTRVPAARNAACPEAVRLAGNQRNYVSGDASRCCYAVVVADPEPTYNRPIRGRAARVDGIARFADVGAGAAWRASPHTATAPRVRTDDGVDVGAGLAPLAAPEPPEPLRAQLAARKFEAPDPLRAQLATRWLEAARMEHASIASFANLSLRLLALGAPPELVAGAHAAALDEIAHARVAFELASRYAGAPLAPLAFPDAARMTATGTIADLARETFVDGCINETVAALEAELAAETARDPELATTLRGISADEARHAELAWAIVAWCVRCAPDVARDLHAVLAEAIGATGIASAAAPALAADLAGYGVLDDAALASARAGVLRDVVAPCLAALAA